jgi:hypothetical protein
MELAEIDRRKRIALGHEVDLDDSRIGLREGVGFEEFERRLVRRENIIKEQEENRKKDFELRKEKMKDMKKELDLMVDKTTTHGFCLSGSKQQSNGLDFLMNVHSNIQKCDIIFQENEIEDDSADRDVIVENRLRKENYEYVDDRHMILENRPRKKHRGSTRPKKTTKNKEE